MQNENSQKLHSAEVSNSIEGTDLTITATGAVSGDNNGIDAVNYGAGALAINAGEVTGTNGYGVDANNESGGTDLSITTTGMVAGSGGIYADNIGSGDLTINVVDVTGTGFSGINAYNSLVGGDLSITSSGTVAGAVDGIYAVNNGSGMLTISVNQVAGGTGVNTSASTAATVIALGPTAMVTGTTGDGVNAASTGANATITVQGSSGIIIGATDGVEIDTMGADIVVNNLDSVTGNAGDGINVASMGGAITVTNADTVLGAGGNGILASVPNQEFAE